MTAHPFASPDTPTATDAAVLPDLTAARPHIPTARAATGTAPTTTAGTLDDTDGTDALPRPARLRVRRSTGTRVVRLVGAAVVSVAVAALLWGTGSTAARAVGALALLVLAPVALSVGPPAPVRRPVDLLGSAALLCAALALLAPSGSTSPLVSSVLVGVGTGAYAAVQTATGRGRRVLCLCSAQELQRIADAVSRAELEYLPHLDREDGAEAGDDLVALRDQHSADLLVLGAQRLSDPSLGDHVARLYARDVHARTVGEFIEEVGGRVPVQHLSVRWFLHDVMAVHVRWYRVLRRAVDVVVGAVGCVVLLVLLPPLALVIRLDSPGPVLYRQRRVGLGGRVFELVKLRTMTCDAEAGGPCFASTKDPRVTRAGRWLRGSRLDELPQVWNVLKGEMTLIGPRPERPEFVAGRFDEIPYYEFRHIVRPGVTGWAQVTEGYTSDLEGAVRKLERDLYYLRHQGIALDVRVLVLTVSCVLRLAGR